MLILFVLVVLIIFATAGGTPYTPEQILSIAYLSMKMTGMFKDELKDWDRPGQIKNWPNFKRMISKANKTLCCAQPSAGSSMVAWCACAALVLSRSLECFSWATCGSTGSAHRLVRSSVALWRQRFPGGELDCPTRPVDGGGVPPSGRSRGRRGE